MTSYSEFTMGARRDFELHSGHLVIRAKKAFVYSSERTITLAELNPFPERGILRVRHNASFAGLVLALFVLMIFFGNIDWRKTNFFWFEFPAALIAFGILAVIFYRRRIEYRIFSFKSGIVAFDVMRRGKQSGAFAAFCDTLEESIKKAS